MRPNCIFVGNIPQDASEQQMEAFFSKVGTVLQFKIMVDKESRYPRHKSILYNLLFRAHQFAQNRLFAVKFVVRKKMLNNGRMCVMFRKPKAEHLGKNRQEGRNLKKGKEGEEE